MVLSVEGILPAGTVPLSPVTQAAPPADKPMNMGQAHPAEKRKPDLDRPPGCGMSGAHIPKNIFGDQHGRTV